MYLILRRHAVHYVSAQQVPRAGALSKRIDRIRSAVLNGKLINQISRGCGRKTSCRDDGSTSALGMTSFEGVGCGHIIKLGGKGGHPVGWTAEVYRNVLGSGDYV